MATDREQRQAMLTEIKTWRDAGLLAQWRTGAELSLSKAAEQAGVSESTLRNWERPEDAQWSQRPRGTNIDRYHAALLRWRKQAVKKFRAKQTKLRVDQTVPGLLQVLRAYRDGEDTAGELCTAFVAEHGDLFPERPGSVEALADALAEQAGQSREEVVAGYVDLPALVGRRVAAARRRSGRREGAAPVS